MARTPKIVAVSGGLQRPSRTLPIGVYATDKEFDNCRVSSDALKARIALAVERALPALRQRAQGQVEIPVLSLA